jgi:phosphoribosylamine--glycine ligase
MRILVLGSGGREHALAWKLSESPRCEALFVAPGNGGTEAIATNLAANPTDFDAIADIIMEKRIDMVVVGPEAPLVEGIYDHFKQREGFSHIAIIGPSKAAAMLEGSKSFAKEFMQRNGIPTASYREFGRENLEAGLSYLQEQKPPIVLKADGLAAGKGVIICQSIEEAKEELKAMLADAKFGEASSKVVVEDFLSGREYSVFVLTDGEHFKILPVARDYKRVGDGDTGPNTGGMGAISPVDFVSDELLEKSIEKVVQPTIDGLKKEGLEYKGFIYCGLIEVQGEPFVIEYNVRMGDPETQVVMPRLESDLVDLLEAVHKGQLDEIDMQISEDYAATIVLASEGYPGSYEKGKDIRGLEFKPDIHYFQAGTDRSSGKLKTAGGRVLAITGTGPTLKIALAKAYFTANEVVFEGKYYRKDIGS